jgi:hypothetical protein
VLLFVVYRGIKDNLDQFWNYGNLGNLTFPCGLSGQLHCNIHFSEWLGWGQCKEHLRIMITAKEMSSQSRAFANILNRFFNPSSGNTDIVWSMNGRRG